MINLHAVQRERVEAEKGAHNSNIAFKTAILHLTHIIDYHNRRYIGCIKTSTNNLHTVAKDMRMRKKEQSNEIVMFVQTYFILFEHISILFAVVKWWAWFDEWKTQLHSTFGWKPPTGIQWIISTVWFDPSECDDVFQLNPDTQSTFTCHCPTI